MKNTVTFRIDEADIMALREQGINAGPYVRKLIKMLVKGEKIPNQLDVDKEMNQWKLVRVKVRV